MVNIKTGSLEGFLIGNTEISLDNNGSAAGGETLTITLEGVDLFTEYGVTIDGDYDNADYAVIIAGLIDDDALIIDVP